VLESKKQGTPYDGTQSVARRDATLIAILGTVKRRFITLDQVLPTVDLASCFHLVYPIWHKYRVPSHHLLLVESGIVKAKTPHGQFIAKAGDLLCFRPTSLNEYGHSGPTLLYQAHVQFAPPPRDRCTPLLDEYGPLPVHVSLGNAFDEMRRAFETLCIEIVQDGALHRERQRIAVHEILAIIMSTLTHQPTSRLQLDKWLRLRLKLEASLHSDFNVDQLAREMGLSRTYFTRAFRQHFGLSPRAYHTYARLREAARLLRTTERSIKSVAFDVGFTTPKLLTRLCRRHLGVLPSDLRVGLGPHPDKVVPVEGKLFPVNKQLLPPKTPANWFKRFYPWLRQMP
jgi:AraC-like DNA-binding protein